MNLPGGGPYPGSPVPSISMTPRSSGFRRFPVTGRPSISGGGGVSGGHRPAIGGLGLPSTPFGGGPSLGPGSPFGTRARPPGMDNQADPFPLTATPSATLGRLPDHFSLESTPAPNRHIFSTFSPFRQTTGIPPMHSVTASVHLEAERHFPLNLEKPLAGSSADAKAPSERSGAPLDEVIDRLRGWRRFAMDGLMWDTAVYWGEKVLSMTQNVYDLYALCYIHIAAGNLHRAEYLLLAHPQYVAFTYSSWACRYLAALASLQLGKYADTLWILGEQPRYGSGASGFGVGGAGPSSASSRRFSSTAKDGRTSIGGSIDRRPLWKTSAKGSRQGRSSVSGGPAGSKARYPPDFPDLLNSHLSTPISTALDRDHHEFKLPHTDAKTPQPPTTLLGHSGGTFPSPFGPSHDPPMYMTVADTPTKPSQPVGTMLADVDLPSDSTFLANPFTHRLDFLAPPAPRTVKFATLDGSPESTTTSTADTATTSIPAKPTHTKPMETTFGHPMVSPFPSTKPPVDWPEEAGSLRPPSPVGINFNSAISYLRGRAYLNQQGLFRAKQSLKESVLFDVRNVQAYQLILDSQLLTPAELLRFVHNLPFHAQLGSLDGDLVRDLYLTKLNTLHPYASSATQPRKGAVSPPTMEAHRTPADEKLDALVPLGFETALTNLVDRFRLRHNPDLWTAGAERAYVRGQIHDCFTLTSAVLRSDPYHLATLPLHIACLYSLRMKHQLFYLAHDLVDYFHHHILARASAPAIAVSSVSTAAASLFPPGRSPGPALAGDSARGRFADSHGLWPDSTAAGSDGNPWRPHGASSVSFLAGAGPTSAQADRSAMITQTSKESAQPIPWFAVGCYYLLVGDYAQSRRYFSRACSLDAHCGPAWVGFAHSFAAEAEHEPATTAYSAAFRLFPGSPLLPQFLGMQYLQMDSLVLAQDFLLTAVRHCVGDYLHHHRPTAPPSSTRVTELTEDPLPPLGPPTANREVRVQGATIPFAQAMSDTGAAHQLADTLVNSSLLNELGTLAYKQGRYPVALVYLERAEAVLAQPDPAFRSAVVALLGDSAPPGLTPSVSSATTAAKNPGQYGSGSLFTANGTVAPVVASGLETIWVNLAHTHRQLRQYPEALKYLEKVRAVSPHDCNVLTTMAMIYHILGQLDEAIMLYHQILSVQPNDISSSKLLQLAVEQMTRRQGLPESIEALPERHLTPDRDSGERSHSISQPTPRSPARNGPVDANTFTVAVPQPRPPGRFAWTTTSSVEPGPNYDESDMEMEIEEDL
ncbi:anaphase-promoting complex subunit Cut9 [Dimargaris cristalligena]|nr:anaphase-promoting complex subunit Cut9 [Dimargaris cristalligena]